MVRLEGTVDTDRPLEEIWSLVVDLRNLARWGPGILDVVPLTDGPIREGSRYRVDFRWGPLTTPLDCRILVLDPPNRLVVESVGWTVRTIDDARVEPFDGGTRLAWRTDLRLRGPLTVGEPVLRPLLRAYADRAVDGLQRWLPAARAARTSVGTAVDGSQGVSLGAPLRF